MRICFVCTEKLPVPPLRGGAIQAYIDGVLPYLAAVHKAMVICRSDPALPPREETGDVRFVRVPPEAYVAGVAHALAAEGPFDVVVLYNRPAWLGALAPALGGAALVLSLHNEMLRPERLTASEAALAVGLPAAIICISDYIRRRTAEGYPHLAGKLRTIRSGVDTDRLRPASPDERKAACRELGLDPDRPVVLHVSRLSPNKGSHLAVQAVAQLRRDHPGVQILLVGSSRYGSDRLEPYGQAVVDAGRALLGPAFVHAGFVPPAQLPAYFAAGDVFLCTSQWAEPLARVHYEAMAAGLPLVTTDRGGNAEVVEEGGNGLFARPHDEPAAFADCLGALLTDGALRRKMGRRGRYLAEERYTFRRVADELLQVLADAAR